MRTVCNSKAVEGGGSTVRTLYEAALREVRADPVAAVSKYEPTWLAALSPGSPRAAGEAAARPAKRRER